MYGPAVGVVRHWFSKRSGLVLGILAAGSSFGGIVFPVVGKNLLPHVGCVLDAAFVRVVFDDITFRFKWTVRVSGFIMLVAVGVANIVS